MSGFFSGSFDPTWPHILLLTISILAGFGVAVGIVLENPKWSLANALVVGGVAIEAVCTLLLFGFDEGISAKQQRDILTATDRATDAGFDAALANNSAAEAIERAAKLEKEAARLQKLAGPRTIDGEAFKKSLEGAPKAPVEIMFPRDDGEAFRLAIQLRDVLRYSDWQASEPTPVPPGDVSRLQNQPSVASFGSYSGTGIVVVIRADTQEQLNAIRNVKAPTPLNALTGALTEALGSAGAAAAGPDVFHVPPPDVLRVVIGTKP